MRDRFTVTREHSDMIASLSAREFKALWQGVLDYVFYDEMPEFKQRTLTSMFAIIKRDLDRKLSEADRQKRMRDNTEDNTHDNTPYNTAYNTRDNTQYNTHESTRTVTECEKKRENAPVSFSPTPPLSLTPKESKRENIYITRARKIPPSLEDVKAYCEERKNGIDAERFMDFYASKGWMVGKNKMVDWQAAVRQWERTRVAEKPKKQNKTASHLRDPEPNKYDEMRRLNQEYLVRLAEEG